MNYPSIINIQKFSIHDGAGIRTTIFFKGCPLSCMWCHNPESQRYQPEPMFYPDRCIGCGFCAKVCPNQAISADIKTDRTRCTSCGHCTDFCIKDARSIVGKTYTTDELMEEIAKDMPFYEVSGGGITLSGGEVLTQDMDYIEELCRKLKRRGYHIDIDTCGHVPYKNIERILPYTDVFLYDLKAMDPEIHKTYTGVDNALILENLKKLSEAGGTINIRIPVIGGVNDSDEEIDRMLQFLSGIRVFCVNLLPYHTTGSDKYERLDRTYHGVRLTVPSKERMEELRQKFQDAGFSNVQIGG